MRDYIYVTYHALSQPFVYAKSGNSWIDKIGKFFMWVWVYHFTCYMIANQWSYWIKEKDN